MIVMKKAIPRRTMLRGLGAAVALPLLDGMVPAFAAVRTTVAARKPRLGFVYTPNGQSMRDWTPTSLGRDFEITPILKPLEAYRDRMLVVSGLDLKTAVPRPGDPGGAHGRCSGSFLTGVHVKGTDGADFAAGISVDQIAAKALGRETQLASLELSLDPTDMAGACDIGLSCAYMNTLSWTDPTTPLPNENSPRAVFTRLFGEGGTDPAARRAQVQRDRSVLDWVRESISRLNQELGAPDQAKLDEYLTSIRDVERRLQRAEEQSDRELPEVARPASSIPAAFEDYTKLMFDLQVLAYQADLTRIITFMVSREISSRAYPEIGVPEGHHPVSHHVHLEDNLVKYAKIGAYHTQLFSYYLDRLAATPDGEGSLLDQTTIVYGSGLSDGNAHSPLDLPLLVLGGPAGSAGRHIRAPEDTPFSNLQLSLLDKIGVPGVEHFGDSTGRFDVFTDV